MINYMRITNTRLLTCMSGIVMSATCEIVAVYGDVARCAIKYRDKIFAYQDFISSAAVASESSRRDRLAVPSHGVPHPKTRVLRERFSAHLTCVRIARVTPSQSSSRPTTLIIALCRRRLPPIEITSERPRRS